jgi:hypothetical protein
MRVARPDTNHSGGGGYASVSQQYINISGLDNSNLMTLEISDLF